MKLLEEDVANKPSEKPNDSKKLNFLNNSIDLAKGKLPKIPLIFP